MRTRVDTVTAAMWVLAILVSCAPARASDLNEFTSDGCSLFPDSSIGDRTTWCDCCLEHDIAYWRGGTEDERKRSDEELRDCVFKRTGDKALAGTMYLGVRAAGHPVFPAGYRWAYGWPYGRGYKPLSNAENDKVRSRLDDYRKKHPAGYCGERGPGSAAAGTALVRPATWAVAAPAKHLKNFFRLDAKVYRSAQPDEKGFQELETLGIRNVLNLRDHHKDDDAAKGTGLTLHRLEMSAGDIRTDDVVAALRIIRLSEGPIVIHCWHGSDRTGTISALYRIVFQNWSKEEAVEELMNGGYGYHAMYKNIPEFIRGADIESIRKRVFAP